MNESKYTYKYQLFYTIDTQQFYFGFFGDIPNAYHANSLIEEGYRMMMDIQQPVLIRSEHIIKKETKHINAKAYSVINNYTNEEYKLLKANDSQKEEIELRNNMNWNQREGVCKSL